MAFDGPLTAEQIRLVEAERNCLFYKTGIKLTPDELLEKVTAERWLAKGKELTNEEWGIGVDGQRFRHGTMNAYANHKCRCETCRAHATMRARKIRKAKAYGQWEDPYVPAGPVRKHVQHLGAQGLGRKQIAELAGVTPSVVIKLVAGRYGSELVQGQTTRPKHITKILKKNAEKLMAVEFDIDLVRGGTSVPSLGARRRVEALMCLGYSQSFQAEYIGWQATNFSLMLKRKTITADTHRAIVEMFDELQMIRRKSEDHYEKIGIARTLNTAKRLGYAPPMAWDDIDNDEAPVEVAIDNELLDTVKVDLLLAGDKVVFTKRERGLAIQELHRRGVSFNDIDNLLGYSGYANKYIQRQKQAA